MSNSCTTATDAAAASAVGRPEPQEVADGTHGDDYRRRLDLEVEHYIPDMDWSEGDADMASSADSRNW
jgi:hypothetical protein